MWDSTSLYFYVKKFSMNHEEEGLLTNLNWKNSKQSRVHKGCEDLIYTNVIWMMLSKLEFQYTLVVPSW